jgi:membrane protein YdbS with pleckstrin-like domain
MKCNQCGAESPANATFCPSCGVQLTDSGSGAGTTGRVPGVQRLHGAARPAATNQPPEQDLWAGSYSAKAMAGPAIGAALLTVIGLVAVVITGGQPAAWIGLGIGALIAWSALGLIVLWNRLTVSYRLTSYRLFHEKGLLNRTRDRIEVIDIDDVTLTQGLIERMFNVGTIHILSSDESLKNEKNPDGKLAMPGIEYARAIADLIDNTRRTERNRRGVFLENV